MAAIVGMRTLTQQASLLRLSRSSVYYLPRPVAPALLAIMHRIDALHLEYPFAGSRMLRDLLRAEGIAIGRLAVTTLMRRMGIEALYRRPNTSKAAPRHKIYPYLLRGLVVDRPNQVWAMDITYIAMARGFVYLAAVVDWFSRRVLAWRLSITLETEFCLEAVGEALARHGKPEIFNTDQGSQFVSVRPGPFRCDCYAVIYCADVASWLIFQGTSSPMRLMVCPSAILAKASHK